MTDKKLQRTQVAIIGAGPAGLLLSQLLHVAGIESVVLERHARAYVEARIRAGVLEQNTVDLLHRADADTRLRAESLRHDGIKLVANGEIFRVDFRALTGGHVTIYGQTEIIKDLIETGLARGTPIFFEAEDVAIHDIESAQPFVTFRIAGATRRLDCDFVAGCDGQHGISHSSIPPALHQTFERAYPFGWLGLMADCSPADEEVVYANHERGLGLASMRSRTRSRYYIQVPMDERLEDWPDARFWDEIALRLGPAIAPHVRPAPPLEKSIAPLRSAVTDPMQHGRLFLAGDAAHIVPPTGAKGLNLAAADAHFLAEAFIAFYRLGNETKLKIYSETALSRVWKAERFSWWFTRLMHNFPDADMFDRKMQMAELEYMRRSRAAQMTLAENYVGLPFG